jgi:hypothetical protein
MTFGCVCGFVTVIAGRLLTIMGSMTGATIAGTITLIIAIPLSTPIHHLITIGAITIIGTVITTHTAQESLL